MKKFALPFLALTGLLLSAGISATAQQRTEEREITIEKVKEYDEIIIKPKKTDSDIKLTIEIKDGEVLVDGKSLAEFDDEKVAVQKRSAPRFRAAVAGSPFRGQTGVWNLERGDQAFLGVSSEASEGKGARVVKTTENSAAAKAGLKEGDIITKVDDTKIESPADLSEAIRSKKPEDKITITFTRNGKQEKATAVLGKSAVSIYSGQAPRMEPFDMENFRFENLEGLRNFEFDGKGNSFMFNTRPRIGIRAQDTEDGKGVKVLGVDKNSAAEKAGLQENDIITEFDGTKVNSADELVKASRESKDKNDLKVKYNRNGSSRTAEIKIPKKLKTANL